MLLSVCPVQLWIVPLIFLKANSYYEMKQDKCNGPLKLIEDVMNFFQRCAMQIGVEERIDAATEGIVKALFFNTDFHKN